MGAACTAGTASGTPSSLVRLLLGKLLLSHKPTVQARLDVLDAETEGQLGFILELELGNALPQRQVAALLTQVVVEPADPAFQRPTKQVGPHYSQEVRGQAGASGRGRALLLRPALHSSATKRAAPCTISLSS